MDWFGSGLVRRSSPDILRLPNSSFGLGLPIKAPSSATFGISTMTCGVSCRPNATKPLQPLAKQRIGSFADPKQRGDRTHTEELSNRGQRFAKKGSQ